MSPGESKKYTLDTNKGKNKGKKVQGGIILCLIKRDGKNVYIYQLKK